MTTREKIRPPVLSAEEARRLHGDALVIDSQQPPATSGFLFTETMREALREFHAMGMTPRPGHSDTAGDGRPRDTGVGGGAGAVPRLLGGLRGQRGLWDLRRARSDRPGLRDVRHGHRPGEVNSGRAGRQDAVGSQGRRHRTGLPREQVRSRHRLPEHHALHRQAGADRRLPQHGTADVPALLQHRDARG